VTCREFVDFLMGYMDGELPSRQQGVFEQHMRMCPPCQVYLDAYAESVRLGRAVCSDPEGPVPEEVPEEFVRAILEARSADS